MTLDISVVFEPFAIIFTVYVVLPRGYKIPLSPRDFRPPFGGQPLPKKFFSIANCGKFPKSTFLKRCTAVRRQVLLLTLLSLIGASVGFWGLGVFFHFGNFSIPSGGPICTRGAPTPLQYDAP